MSSDIQQYQTDFASAEALYQQNMQQLQALLRSSPGMQPAVPTRPDQIGD